VEAKEFWQSKTFWVNVMVIVVAVLDLLSKQPFVPPQYVPFVLFAVGVVNIVLRAITDKPVTFGLLKR
jgi:hypothetical protein